MKMMSMKTRATKRGSRNMRPRDANKTSAPSMSSMMEKPTKDGRPKHS